MNNANKTANLLLTQGVEICAKDTSGLTPLHWAASENANKTARKTVADTGSEINAKDNKGSTPLHWAAGNNTAEMAKLLLTQGANVNEKDESWRDAAVLCTGRR